MENMWVTKEELPDFTGRNPVGWIARAERFFEEQEVHLCDKLQWAFMSMEGEAMIWFHSWCQEDLDADWESFSQALIRRFKYANRTFDGLTTWKQDDRREEGSPITVVEQSTKKMEKSQKNNDDDVEKRIKEGGSNHLDRPGLLGLGLLSENWPKFNTVHFQGSNLKPLSSFGSSSARSRPDPVLPSDPPAPPDPPDPPKLLSLESQERTGLTMIPPEPPNLFLSAMPSSRNLPIAPPFTKETNPPPMDLLWSSHSPSAPSVLHSTFNPRTRDQAIKLARDVEAELRGSLLPRGSGGGNTREWRGGRDANSGAFGKGEFGSDHNPSFTKGSVGPGPIGNTQSKTLSTQSHTGLIQSFQSGRPSRGDGSRSNSGDRSRGIKHLPYSELMERQAHGLSFRCGERNRPWHQCAEKQLRLLILGDDEEVLAIKAYENEEEEEESLDLFGTFGLNIDAVVLDLGGLDMILGVSGMKKYKSVHAVTNSDCLAFCNVTIWANGSNKAYESASEMTSMHSPILVSQWDPGGDNFAMAVIAYEYCWRSCLIFYGLINLVFDRGKIWEIQTKLLSNISSLDKLILIWFSSKLMSLPDARRAIETTSNLEDKVVSQGGGSDRTPGPKDEKVIRRDKVGTYKGVIRRDKGGIVVIDKILRIRD